MSNLTPYEQQLKINGSLLFRSTGPNPILSHFYHCRIEIDGAEYSSVEQAYQFFKVKNIFKDDATAEKIMSTNNPREQKSLGNLVQSKNRELRVRWDMIKELVIFALDKQKYNQMPDIKQLFRTHPDQKIYEFVRCTFWGIGNKGMGGQNKSGKIWERIRSGKFPDIIAISDGNLTSITIPQTESYVIPDADFAFISSVAKFVKFLPSRGIIIDAGANDLYDENGSFRPVNLLARRILNTAKLIAESNPSIFVVLSPILPRNTCTKHIKKIKKIVEIVKEKKRELNSRIYVLDIFDVFWDGFHAHRDLFETDGSKLSITGKKKLYDLMSEAVTSLLSNAMQSCTVLV